MDYKRVWAVFQPFTYTRTQMLLDDFARVLQIADKVVMTEIMGSRERAEDYAVRTKDLAAKVPGSVWYDTFDEVVDHVMKNARPGDLVITLGCGDIYKAAKKDGRLGSVRRTLRKAGLPHSGAGLCSLHTEKRRPACSMPGAALFLSERSRAIPHNSKCRIAPADFLAI